MNKTALIAIIFAIAIFAFFYTGIDNTPAKESSSISQTDKEQTDTKPQKKNVEIIYLDEKPKQLEPTIDAVEKKVQKNIEKKVKETHIKQEVHQYIVEKQLQPIRMNTKKDNGSSKNKLTVYSDISLEEAKSLQNTIVPPSAPTIVSGKFQSGESYSVVVPNEVNEQANELIVTKTDEEGNIEESVVIKQNDPQSPMQPPEETEDTQKTETTTIQAPPSPSF
jgi:hypothetical protein